MLTLVRVCHPNYLGRTLLLLLLSLSSSSLLCCRVYDPYDSHRCASDQPGARTLALEVELLRDLKSTISATRRQQKRLASRAHEQTSSAPRAVRWNLTHVVAGAASKGEMLNDRSVEINDNGQRLLIRQQQRSEASATINISASHKMNMCKK